MTMSINERHALRIRRDEELIATWDQVAECHVQWWSEVSLGWTSVDRRAVHCHSPCIHHPSVCLPLAPWSSTCVSASTTPASFARSASTLSSTAKALSPVHNISRSSQPEKNAFTSWLHLTRSESITPKFKSCCTRVMCGVGKFMQIVPMHRQTNWNTWAKVQDIFAEKRQHLTTQNQQISNVSWQ